MKKTYNILTVQKSDKLNGKNKFKAKLSTLTDADLYDEENESNYMLNKKEHRIRKIK